MQSHDRTSALCIESPSLLPAGRKRFAVVVFTIMHPVSAGKTEAVTWRDHTEQILQGIKIDQYVSVLVVDSTTPQSNP